MLEGESAEEQQEGQLELSPCAHLPKRVSGGPALQPALCGVTLPARAAPEYTQLRSAPFRGLIPAAGATGGVLTQRWGRCPMERGQHCLPALSPKGFTGTWGSSGRGFSSPTFFTIFKFCLLTSEMGEQVSHPPRMARCPSWGWRCIDSSGGTDKIAFHPAIHHVLELFNKATPKPAGF